VINAVEETGTDHQARFGRGTPHGGQGRLGRVEHLTPQGPLDLTEQAVLDGVPLGGIGRIVGDAQWQPQAPTERDEVFLEACRAHRVGPASIEGEEELPGLGKAGAKLALPGQGDGIADEFAGLVGGTQGDEAEVVEGVVDPVWDDPSTGQMTIIVGSLVISVML
jgi:hypothetical protein